MTRALDIMRLKPREDNPQFARVISTQQSVIASVFSTTARINEASLKKQQTDKMERLLAELQAEAKRR